MLLVMFQWRHWEGGGRTTPRDTIPEMTRMKLIFAAEFTKNTGQTTLEGAEGGSGDET